VGCGEDLLEGLIAIDLAPDVADQAVQAGAQEPELAVVALELLGVSIASGHDRGPLGDPHIGLPERDTMLPGHLAQHDDRPVRQLDVGREGHGLRLHRGVHHDTFQIPGR
jgi:hypothetical protein